MPVLPQPLSLNPLKDMAKVDQVDYLADFDNLYSKMDDFDSFCQNRQFSFFTILLVNEKSDQHRIIYDSYNVELAGTKIKSITLENASNTYSTFNGIKFDTDDPHNNYLLYDQFVAWYCKGSNIVPLCDYANNPVFQELPSRSEYFTSINEKLFIKLRRGKGYTNEIEKLNRDDSNLIFRIKLKTAAAKKLRLRTTGCYQGEYLYLMSREGLIMN